jgi:methionine salvage enolase-phosphatase E1
MLVGISALTTIGLRRYYAVQSGIPSPNSVCGGDKTRCAAYTRMIESAGIEQLQAIFLGAAICALVAAAVALICFRGAHTRGVSADRAVLGA